MVGIIQGDLVFGRKGLVGSDLRQQKEYVAVVSFVLTWA